MTTSDEDLLERMRPLFDGRRDWKLEPQSGPGLLPVWCLRSQGEPVLSVGVAEGTFSVYVVDRDREIVLADLAALAIWLDTNGALFRERPTLSRELFNQLLDQRIPAPPRDGT